jgi:phosphatidylserine/phosphatidylglycerophosphate/cardiolipin synthase-like enzyme
MSGFSRQIIKSSGRASLEAHDALSNLLIAALLHPNGELFVVSAWISDIPIIDNTAGGFAALQPEWGVRWITMTEALAALATRGVRLRLKMNTTAHNDAFLERLRALLPADADVVVRRDENTHSKGIVGEDSALRGSMNLTYRGLREREETVEIDIDTEAVSTFRIELREDFS